MDNMDEDLFANIPGSKGGGGRIFDRLTDTKTYTGMYANHFEQPPSILFILHSNSFLLSFHVINALGIQVCGWNVSL